MFTLPVAKPIAISDLTYSAAPQLGVAADTADTRYELSASGEGKTPTIDNDGAKATNAGTYGVSASLDDSGKYL